VGDLHTLTTGPVSPIVATIFAALGCLLSILLLTRARQRTGWRRVRLVTYAIPGLALPALVLPALVTVLALRVDGSVLLLVPEPLGYSLAAAAGGTVPALVVLCFGRPGFLRQVLAGILLVAAIGGTGLFLGASLTTTLPIGIRPLPTGLALGLASVTGFGLATALAATRSLRRAVGTATLLGLSLAAVYHVAAIGLTLRPTPDGPIPASDVVGLEPQRVGLPAVAVIAVVLTFTWYFTLGTATMRDLRRTFEPDADAEEIEPWMIEQVRRRVAHTSTASVPVPAWPDDWDRDEPTVAIHAVAIVGRGAARAIGHRAHAALPASPGATRLRAEHGLTKAHPLVPAPDPAAALTGEHTAGPGRPEDHSHGIDTHVTDIHGIDTHGIDTRVTDTHVTDIHGIDTHGVNAQSTGSQRTGMQRIDIQPPDIQRIDTQSVDSRAWPAGRNESAAARAAGAWSSNNRFGSGLAGEADESDPFGDLDPDAWAERLTAARAAVAAENAETPTIVYDFRAGSSLPRRNARPIHRP
jgi:NO-binding membrane sensor protein with MHYT domain